MAQTKKVREQLDKSNEEVRQHLEGQRVKTITIEPDRITLAYSNGETWYLHTPEKGTKDMDAVWLFMRNGDGLNIDTGKFYPKVMDKKVEIKEPKKSKQTKKGEKS